VKFLVDAQLPLRLARFLSVSGHDVVHSSELPDGNRTSDGVLSRQADADGRVMVTKDRDFEVSHLLHGVPAQLLLITTGNISNNALLDLIRTHLGAIEAAFAESSYIELSSVALVVHGRNSTR
jgi:predicted nuclease of predicted toxin-antitoxin system